jgi:hypothetical protein
VTYVAIVKNIVEWMRVIMTTENDIIFDHLYDEFKRTIEADGEYVNLLTYGDENGISDDVMMQMWEAYIIEVGKRNENKK